MDIALCYPSVVPARGGCETYISDLARRLGRDGHGVHIFASHWDASVLPSSTHFYRIAASRGPRFLRPWRFAEACEAALKVVKPGISLGFDKTWGQDILYPQGGLHITTKAHNILKHPPGFGRTLARVGQFFDLTNWSYTKLERKQYLGWRKPLVVVNSDMVRRHFEEYYGYPTDTIRVLHSAIDPLRFVADDRLKLRAEERERWGVTPETPVGLFIATNYRLKGLAQLLKAVAATPRERAFTIVVIGSSDYARYEELAQEYGVRDRVKFLGFRADPKHAYFAADFLVHPTFYDPCSLVVLEALACGLPIVTTQFNGAKELLNASNSVVVQNPHDAAELSAAMLQMIDPAFRSTATSSARDTAKAWTFEQHYLQLVRLFEQVRGLKRAA
jgi:UDP-glucose:(heptosyl)LPS alpha-1,3-glucosyltransferase